MTDVATDDPLTRLQSDYEERGLAAIEDLRNEDPETYALIIAEAAKLLTDEVEDENEQTQRQVLRIICKDGESRARALARHRCSPDALAADSISRLTPNCNEYADVNELISELENQTERLKEGSDSLESLLNSHAHTLNALFHNLVRRGLANIENGYTEPGREYLKLAKKAQAQCRTTVDSLVSIRRPTIRQTNIAHGHQQVNNYENPPNELMEDEDGERMD